MPKAQRVLWLHTQPEHYFNLLIDDLNAHSDLEYIAGYMRRGPGLYKDVPVPRHSRHVFLRVRPGREGNPTTGFRAGHVDWREDIRPLDIACGIVAGYAGVTQRQFITDLHRRGLPVLMMSDSNLRSQRGRTWKQRVKRRLKRRFLAPIIRDTDCLLTMNRLGVAYWRYYGAPKDKIVLCPFYADYQRIEEGRRMSRQEVFASFGLDPARKLLLTAARLVEAKGLDLVIEAFRRSGLAARGWIYAIAGGGPLQGALAALAGEELGRSIFLLGFTQPAKLMPLFAHADLFALPSRYEPHGIVLGEAACAGTPILASDVVGAAKDLVVPGMSGWRFRSEDLGDLTRVLASAVADEGRLAAMRGTTRAVFDEWFARTNPVRVVDREVHRLLGRGSGGRTPVPAAGREVGREPVAPGQARSGEGT